MIRTPELPKLSNKSQMILRYIMGGAALGGSAALANAVTNEIRSVKEDAEAEDPQRQDDETATVTLRKKLASVRGGLALSGGLLSLIGSYQFTKMLNAKRVQKRLNKELDNEQNMYFQLNHPEDEVVSVDKSAGERKSMSTAEHLGAAPVAGSLLLGLMAAIVANKSLQKQFPSPRPLQPQTPKIRRVKVKYLEDEPQPPAPDADVEKIAAFPRDKTGLLNYFVATAELANDARTGFSDLVKAASVPGFLPTIENVLVNAGEDLFWDEVKVASEAVKDSDVGRLVIGASALSGSLVLGPMAEKLAAASFADMHPVTVLQALTFEEKQANAMSNIGAIWFGALRHDFLKTAATAGYLESILQGLPPDAVAKIRSSIDTSDAPSGEDSPETNVTVDEQQAAMGADSGTDVQDKDIIDEMMANTTGSYIEEGVEET